MNKNKLLDILLLPRQTYQKLTDKKFWLYAGIILIGAIDMIFPLLDNRVMIFAGKNMTKLNYNIGMVLLFILILGFLDVLIFTMPLFDLFKVFKKEPPLFTSSNLIRFTKSYVLAHLLVIPFNALVYWILYDYQTAKVYPMYVIVPVVAYSFFIMPTWFAAIISRGANTIFNFDAKIKPMIFMAIFVWNFVISNYVFDYIIKHWVMWFFR